MNYYKVPKDKVSNVLDIMDRSGWSWIDGKPIDAWRHMAEEHSGNEFSVFGIDYHKGKDTGNVYKRVKQNPDYIHEQQNIKNPLKDFKELITLFKSSVISEVK